MEQSQDLALIVDSLFAGAATEMTTRNGIVVRFKRAGIVQLGKATTFISTVVERAPKDKIMEFFELIVGAQSQLMEEGKSVYDLKLNTEGMLVTALQQRSLLLSVFAGVADVIPEFVSIFSTIRETEYMELELDEQLVIAAGVFATNYGFFTQSLPPIIASVLRGLQRANSANGSKQAETASK